MGWLTRWLRSPSSEGNRSDSTKLELLELEKREVPAATATLTAGILSITGGAEDNHIRVDLDPTTGELVVTDNGITINRTASSAVGQINVEPDGGKNRVEVTNAVTQPLSVLGGTGQNLFIGGSGDAVLIGGTGNAKLKGGTANNTLVAGSGNDLLRGNPSSQNTFIGDGGLEKFIRVQSSDVVVPSGTTFIQQDPPNAAALAAAGQFTITPDEVRDILTRASGVTPSNDAIIAIVDRQGNILGVAVENGVADIFKDNPITGLPNNALMQTFAVDGAVALARTGAFFGNNQAPLTSRTIRALSESTMTERVVNANPNLALNDPFRGPGFVAPIGIGAHFPSNVANTPEVDLVQIEGTNRDSSVHPGPDRIKGTPDDIPLPGRFNIDFANIPGSQPISPTDSYGFVSGRFTAGQSRGIGTLPGGIPIYRTANGSTQVIGGIGVFFPGATGFASEENSQLSIDHNPAKPDRSFEAEFIAFAAVGGDPGVGFDLRNLPGLPSLFRPDGSFIAIPSIPPNRIDLVGINLPIFGPEGNDGPNRLAAYGIALGPGTPDFDLLPVNTAGFETLSGVAAPEGWIVPPLDGNGITATEVQQIIMQGIRQANVTRAAIRLSLSVPTRMVFAVSDLDGKVVGLFRMPDATIFSIDVAVAKSRNVAYYANPAQLQQPGDILPGVPAGTAFSNRTFRYLALPRFPSSIDGAPFGPFSILNDGGVDPKTGLLNGPRLLATQFTSVQGFDQFFPGTNFRRGGFPTGPLTPAQQQVFANQSGIVFFPGSAPLYRTNADGSVTLIGGFGVSGDGVDQDDVVTQAGATGFDNTGSILRADDVFVNGIRLPYQKGLRNPLGIGLGRGIEATPDQ